MKKAEMLAEVQRRREQLREASDSNIGDEPMLAAQLANLEHDLRAGTRPSEAWEQHQYHWMAHHAEQHRNLVRQGAQVMLAFEDVLRREPDGVVSDPQLQKLLHWWREEDGREELLGQITIEERRTLENLERQWREQSH